MSFFLTAALLAAQPGLKPLEHTFVYRSQETLHSVSVAGTFNGWNKNANPMKRSVDGSWTTTLQIPPGRHEYKFVCDDQRWIPDPSGKSVDDGLGNTNSLLLLFPTDFAKPALPKDDVVTLSVMGHDQSVRNLNFDKGALHFRFTARPNDLEGVDLVVNGPSGTRNIRMERIAQNELLAEYAAHLPWDQKQALRYTFALRGPKTAYQFGTNGMAAATNVKPFTVSGETYKPFVVPAWVERTVFYQIFPDRFANGDPKNDPEQMANWTDEPTYWNRYGGDAKGVMDNIPYLRSLGVNGVYINPVMMAPSNHRYDPVDFYRIDPEFGTNQEFIQLSEKMQSVGIRLVLDQIFDHVGTTFSPFADLLKFQEKSRYRNWFFVKNYPVEVRQNPPYEGWFGVESMPKINVLHPEVKSYLLESVDYWMTQAKLSGWRLDVANEVPLDFWREFRTRVKAHQSDAWIVGEVWGDANTWLQGDQWDASMNYPFRQAVLQYVGLGVTKSSQFVDGLMSVYHLYPPQVSRNQMNLISSHDTPRFISLAGGNRKLAAMAAVVQFTWPGSPSVYYGEELGMLGGADPENRRPMRWDTANPSNELLRLYRALIHLRKGSDVLVNGEPVVLPSDDKRKIACYARESADDFAVIALNRGSQDYRGTLQLPAKYANQKFLNALDGRELIADSKAQLTVELGSLSSLVALKATPSNSQLIRGAEAASQIPPMEEQS